MLQMRMSPRVITQSKRQGLRSDGSYSVFFLGASPRNKPEARRFVPRHLAHREADQPWKLSTPDARKIGVSRAGAKLCELKSRSSARFAVVQPAADRVPIDPAEDHQK